MTTNSALRWRLLIELGALAGACATGACSFPTEPLGFSDHTTSQTAGTGAATNAGSGGLTAAVGGAGGAIDIGSADAPSGAASGGSGSNSGSGGSAADPGAMTDASVVASDSGSDLPAIDAAVEDCMAHAIDPRRVVMLGDSYNDIGNVGPAIQTAAGATYRPYYLASAAINSGSGQLNIPYQFESMAMTDDANIEVVIMNGGVNDVIVYNGNCLSTPAPDATCAAAIDTTIARTKRFMHDAAAQGVKHFVYYYYPHTDPNGGGIFPSPSYLNDWIDYALDHGLPEMCCGSNTPPAGAADYTCHGSGSDGTIDCVFVDVRSEFVGHADQTDVSNYWFQAGIGVLPNEAGAAAIVDKVRNSMIEYCITP